MLERQHLTAHHKLAYARGQRPKVDCILCAIRDHNTEVDSLEVFRDELFFISVNLYPYNPGHLMIVPLRHICFPTELSNDEALHLHHLQSRALGAIDQLYQPPGYNIGYNLGSAGGGSIDHLHLHLVPRFRNEHGFMASIGQTQIMVESVTEMVEKFKGFFNPI
jgi:ATP adenylyltransferase